MKKKKLIKLLELIEGNPEILIRTAMDPNVDIVGEALGYELSEEDGEEGEVDDEGDGNEGHFHEFSDDDCAENEQEDLEGMAILIDEKLSSIHYEQKENTIYLVSEFAQNVVTELNARISEYTKQQDQAINELEAYMNLENVSGETSTDK